MATLAVWRSDWNRDSLNPRARTCDQPLMDEREEKRRETQREDKFEDKMPWQAIKMGEAS